jgi:hypothetical protein
MRICTDCAVGFPTMRSGILVNLVAVSGSLTDDPHLVLYARPCSSITAPVLSLRLDTVDVYTNDLWSVSFGRQRNDSINSNVSSSYFVKAARQSLGTIEEYHTTSSFFYEKPSSFDDNLLEEHVLAYDMNFGPYIFVGGGQSFNVGTTADYVFLNNTLSSSAESRTKAFSGKLSNVRFWSKALTDIEWKEHVRYYRSMGTVDPLTNFNYIHTPTGSFERLRLDSVTKQDTLSASAGDITLIDYSGNERHMIGENFSDTTTLESQLFDVSFICPTFDEPTTEDKIRPRSFLDQNNVDEHIGSTLAPVYELNPFETPMDDTRLSIEFSLIDALNRDIITIFSTLEAFDNALGDPALMFSADYPGLENMRDMYFNRLDGRLNFKAFHEFFKFFDVSLGTFIEQLIPKKTKFKGLNFIIESHMLERNKFRYYFDEMYMTEVERNNLEKTLLLQQLVGVCRKY